MPLLYLLILTFFFLASPAKCGIFGRLGINYGTVADNLPSPQNSIPHILSLGAGSVKLYDANPSILHALSHTRLSVTVMLPNDLIPLIGANSSLSPATAWIATNLSPFIPSVRFRHLLVGNEILSYPSLSNSTWPFLVPAMTNLKQSLKSLGYRNIKVSTTIAMDALSNSFPPSASAFRPDIALPVMLPLLRFLDSTRSSYFLDVYPYLAWASNSDAIKLDYALFQPGSTKYTDPVSKLTYTNLFDQMLDAVAAAMAGLGFKDIPIVVAETGWPNGCDYDQIGGNVHNAAVYNRNLAKRLSARPAVGTPARPGTKITAFVFALYNEDKKPGPATERHWGLLYSNATNVYDMDLSGRRSLTSFGPLPAPINNELYKGKIWCVLKGDERVNASEVAVAVAYACGQGNGTCVEIQKGGRCYEPHTLAAHASYAFNSYWQQYRRSGGTCDFGGLAVQTIVDPSHGSCKFPSSMN